MPGNEGPVGLFDSGVGGLSVLRAIEASLPSESLLYVADSANAPWGDKPPAFVRDRALAISSFLIAHGAKAIVIGSNTGTAGSAEALRGTLDVPVIGIEPGIKPAVAATRSGVIGAIVPAAVGESDRLRSLVERFGGGVRIVIQPVPGVVEHVETGELDGPELRTMLQGYLAPMLEAGADTIVLGSTHYVWIKPVLRELAGPEVTLVETGDAVSRQLGHVLEERDLLAGDRRGEERFWTSGDLEVSTRVISKLLGRDVSVEKLPDLL
jgi:glutamate racemase